MELREKIEELVLGKIEGTDYFIVDIEISLGRKNKVEVILDGDKGVNIDDCAKISRAIGNAMEEGEWLDTAYELVVASPGVGSPLVLFRQYEKNLGRDLEITLKDGKIQEGKLESATHETLVLSRKKNPRAKASTEIIQTEVPFAEIRQAIVKVSF